MCQGGARRTAVDLMEKRPTDASLPSDASVGPCPVQMPIHAMR